MKRTLILAVLYIALLSFTACSNQDSNQTANNDQAQRKPSVTIMTHDSFSISKQVLAKFEEKLHAKLIILKSGDTGEALNKSILSKNNPMADIFYGVDNIFLNRALKADMFVPYAPKGLENIKPSLLLDPENRLVPVDFGDVCLNYDINWFAKNNKLVPTGLEDIIKPEYKGLTVVQNPATSSPGLAFLLATVARFGQDGFLTYWQQLKDNDVLVTNGWQEAYWGKFTAASDGDRPIVVSYASSPAAEVFYAKEKTNKAPTGVVTKNNSAFRQIEFAGILKGTKDLSLAQKTMDFILSTDFQEDIPLQMFVFPANITADLPAVFKQYAIITDTPGVLDYQVINAKRDVWIREWTELILQ